MKKTRTQNVIRNMWVGTLFQMISLVLGFPTLYWMLKYIWKHCNDIL